MHYTISYLPGISNKWENSIIEEHDHENNYPEAEREMSDVCKFLQKKK